MCSPWFPGGGGGGAVGGDLLRKSTQLTNQTKEKIKRHTELEGGGRGGGEEREREDNTLLHRDKDLCTSRLFLQICP